MAFPRHSIRILFIAVWLVLFGALLQRDYFIRSIDTPEAQVIKRGREESFAGIYFDNERIGYVKNRLTESGEDAYILYEDAFLYLNILNETHPVDMRIKATLGRDMLLRDFTFHFTSPFYKIDAEGLVEGGDVHFSLITGKETIENVMHLQKPPYLSTNRRHYLLEQGLQPGDKLKVPYFDPISLAGKDTVMEYKGRQKILVKNRVYNLHHFAETFSGIRINSWLDDEGRVIREESPAGFVFIAEPEFKATDIKRKGREILSSVSIPLEGGHVNLAGRNSIRYRLTLPPGVAFDLDKDRQTLMDDTLTVNLESLPAPEAAACQGYTAELASTPYIQTKNKRIKELARTATANASNDLERAELLSTWIFRNLEKRPVLGIPDALTTLRTRIGDCNEHAALFAALARSTGIPTRVVAGVTYFDGAFYYHAWNEVCLDDRWYSIDTTNNEFPADLGHIKFVEGETDEQLRIAALLGKLQIAIAADKND